MNRRRPTGVALRRSRLCQVLPSLDGGIPPICAAVCGTLVAVLAEVGRARAGAVSGAVTGVGVGVLVMSVARGPVRERAAAWAGLYAARREICGASRG